MSNSIILGLLVLVIGISTMPVFAEDEIQSPEFIGIKTSCSDPTLKSDDSFSNTITIHSSPLIMPDENPHEGMIYERGPPPYCILPSSISVQVPNKVPVGDAFDVIITPSFELTQQQLDDYNKYFKPKVTDAQELWNTVCYDVWRYYGISHPATYELSGDNVSYYGHRMSQNYFPPYEIHTTEVRELNFNGEPATFQMTIHEPIVYLASDLNDKENMDYLKYDYGRLVIKPATTHVYRTIPPVSIYTSIDECIVTLSGHKPDRSPTTIKLEDLNPDDQVIPHPNYPSEVYTTPITPTLPIMMFYGMLGMIIITGIALFIFNNRTLKNKKQ